MLSYQAIVVPQTGHADPGLTMDFFKGTRPMRTVEKLPKAKPKSPATIHAI